jgi:hypothetical protein
MSRCCSNFQRGRAQSRKKTFSAGQDDDLYILSGSHEHIEHAFDTAVVGKSESIIEDNGRWPSLSEQEFCEG